MVLLEHTRGDKTFETTTFHEYQLVAATTFDTPAQLAAFVRHQETVQTGPGVVHLDTFLNYTSLGLSSLAGLGTDLRYNNRSALLWVAAGTPHPLLGAYCYVHKSA